MPVAPIILLATTLLLGGMLSVEHAALRRWSWSGAWEYPVGTPGVPNADGLPLADYRLLRGFEPVARGTHRGADIGNGRSGGPVRSSAHGIVVQAVRGDTLSAWGDRVVVAHRLPEDRLVYSIYAHLLAGSIRVRAGDRVRAGQTLARVGRSGNATTPHLHFEIRGGGNPTERWEKAEALDPIAFVRDRLTSCWHLDKDAAPLRRWAEQGALIAIGAGDQEPLSRSAWWSMLARAARHDLGRLPGSDDSLAASLAAAGLLGGGDAGNPEQTPGWAEIGGDLERLRRRGLRLPPPSSASGWLPRALGERFGSREKSRDPRRYPPLRPAIVSDALLLIAEAATPRTTTPRTRKTAPTTVH